MREDRVNVYDSNGNTMTYILLINVQSAILCVECSAIKSNYIHASKPSQNRTPCHAKYQHTLPIPTYSLQNNNQQHQDNDQNNNRSHLHIILRLPRHTPQILPRFIKRTLMPIDPPINLIQHLHMPIQLIPNLDTQLPLPSYTLPQSIQRFILLSNNLRVVRVDLLVIQMRLVGRRGGWIVPVGKELVARGVVFFLQERRV